MNISALLMFTFFIMTRGRVIVLPLYGDVHTHGYYYIKIGVGLPLKQLQTLIVDTGSSLTGFTCKECLNCGKHEYKPFNINLSATSNVIECKENNFLKNEKELISDYWGITNTNYSKYNFSYIENKCVYDIKYSEGSRIFGYFFEDFTEFENELSSNLENWWKFDNKFVLGCNLVENHLIKYQKASGILGLANYNKKKMNKIINYIFQNDEAKGVYTEKIISIFFEKSGGKLTFGSTNFEHTLIENNSSGVYNVTSCFNDERYCAYVSKVEVDSDIPNADTKIKENLFKAIFDTGTTISILPARLFNKVTRKLFKTVSKHYPQISGYDEKDGLTCWKIDNGISIDKFPNIKITFENGHEQYTESMVVSWSPYSYLYLLKTLGGNVKVYCLGITSNNLLRLETMDLSHNETNLQNINEIILGATFFIYNEITFFLNENKIMIRNYHPGVNNINYIMPYSMRSFGNKSKNSGSIEENRDHIEKNAIKAHEHKYDNVSPRIVYKKDIYPRGKYFGALIISSSLILMTLFTIFAMYRKVSKQPSYPERNIRLFGQMSLLIM